MSSEESYLYIYVIFYLKVFIHLSQNLLLIILDLNMSTYKKNLKKLQG